MKVRKSIVDKNGKHTTVFVNPFKRDNTDSRIKGLQSIPQSSQISKIPSQADEYSRFFDKQQLAQHFPHVQDVRIFDMNREFFKRPNRIQFTANKIPIKGNYKDLVGVHIAADLAKDFYDTEAGFSLDQENHFVLVHMAKDLPDNYSGEDIQTIYDGFSDKLKEVNDDPKNAFAKAIKKQMNVAKSISGFSDNEMIELASSNDIEALRAIPYMVRPYIKMRNMHDGRTWLALAKNTNTPMSTIEKIVEGYDRTQRSTVEYAFEALQEISKRSDLKPQVMESVVKEIASYRSNIDNDTLIW